VVHFIGIGAGSGTGATLNAISNSFTAGNSTNFINQRISL
jgi:hypothetical protein